MIFYVEIKMLRNLLIWDTHLWWSNVNSQILFFPLRYTCKNALLYRGNTPLYLDMISNERKQKVHIGLHHGANCLAVVYRFDLKERTERLRFQTVFKLLPPDHRLLDFTIQINWGGKNASLFGNIHWSIHKIATVCVF